MWSRSYKIVDKWVKTSGVIRDDVTRNNNQDVNFILDKSRSRHQPSLDMQIYDTSTTKV